MAEKGGYSAPAVEKAFAVLDLISHHPDGLRMIDVVERLALPRTSTFVLLRSLERMGYLHIDSENRYRLTLRLFSLGMRAMNQSAVVAVAHPHLQRLAAETGLTVHLAALERADAVYLARIDGASLIRFDTYVGKRSPAHLTAVGKAMLAHVPSNELDELMSAFEFSAGTTKAAHSAAALQRALETIREQGYAVEDGEEVEGVRCVAAPVIHRDARVVAAVGIIQVKSLLDDEQTAKVARFVFRAAQDTARDMGSLSVA